MEVLGACIFNGGQRQKSEREAVRAEEEDQTRAMPCKSVGERGRDNKQSQIPGPFDIE